MSEPNKDDQQRLAVDIGSKAHLNIRLLPSQKAFLIECAEKWGFKNPRDGTWDKSAACSKILTDYQLLGLQTSEEFRPEMCKGCLQYGGRTNEGILCIIKKSETDPVRYEFKPLAVAKACSDKPFNTFPDRKSRQQYENQISLLTIEKDSAIAARKRDHGKLELLKGIEKERDHALSENQWLNEELKRLPALLKEIDGLHALQTDYEYWKRLAEERSHDPLVQKYKELSDQFEEMQQAMKIQESNHSAELEELRLEINKYATLAKAEKDNISDIRFTVEKALIDFKQFLPSGSPACDICSEGGFKLKEYRQSALKTIENLQGYLQTVAR